ncbi:MAG: hypothetical protein JWO82_317 [Akkermansiaceae bacterium]|nr:hypothetical protein [Akkermansiaceae bacterium]
MIRTLSIATILALTAARAEDANPFGHDDKERSGLIAIIYDLKQTQRRQPSGVSSGDYPQVIRQFLSKGWDEEVLNRFFRITRPLYSTQIFIPRIDAGAAPKAFGVQDVIQPSEWVVHYKGQVSPPCDGIFRFVGYADDVLAVGVNGKTVLIGSRPDMDLKSVWSPTASPGARAFNGDLERGDWLELHKGTPIDLDVLVGERPGGDFCAFLLYEMKGATYPKDANGIPIFPVFQLAPQDVPANTGNLAPPFIKSPDLWQQVR